MKISDVYNRGHDEESLKGLNVKTPGGKYGVVVNLLFLNNDPCCTIDGDKYFSSWNKSDTRKGSYKLDELELMKISGVLNFYNEKWWIATEKRNFCGNYDAVTHIFSGYITGVGEVSIETTGSLLDIDLKKYVIDFLKPKK